MNTAHCGSLSRLYGLETRTPDTVVASVGRFDGLICGLLACKLHGSVVDAQ